MSHLLRNVVRLIAFQIKFFERFFLNQEKFLNFSNINAIISVLLTMYVTPQNNEEINFKIE